MRWELRQVDEHLVQELSERLGVNKFVAKLLVLRGIKTEEDAKRFLNPTRQTLRSPFLLKDMEKAVEILLRARDNGEKVIIHKLNQLLFQL
ncbi:MAG TPA: hypothetical protein PK390_02790 [Fervidobacterium nodosum]|nr:hypothetical protein [Fervidobacterium nodosum]